MAIHTFSSRPRDEKIVQQVKDKCDKRGLMFSRLVIDLLKQWDSKDEQTSNTDKTA